MPKTVTTLGVDLCTSLFFYLNVLEAYSNPWLDPWLIHGGDLMVFEGNFVKLKHMEFPEKW